MLEGFRTRVARMIAPAAVRRYDAASLGRRTFGMASFGRVNAEVGAASATLAARSAHATENNPLIQNGVANLVGETIGSGIRPTPQHDSADVRETLIREFDQWAELCDADGRQNFWGLQASVFRDVVVRGEALVHLIATDAGLRLRQLDVEQLDRSLTRNLADGATIVQGVEFDRNGIRVAYWIAPFRDDTFAGWAAPVRVDASDIVHVFRPSFPGQVRGVPWTASILLTASEFDKFADALLMGASVAAMMCGFVTDENQIGDGDPFDGADAQSLEPGSLIRLKGGQKVTMSAPQQFAAAESFAKLQIRSLAAGLGVPSFMLDGDLTGANYSSLRAGLLPFRRRTEQFIYGVFVPQMLAPIWRRFLAVEASAAVAAGVEWIAPAPLQVDPAKAVEADVAEIEAGLASRRQKVSERGWSIEALDAEIAADRKRESDLGLQHGETTAKDSLDVINQ